MADVTVTSAEQAADGTVTILGSNFTQTTTTVAVDGVDAAFTFISATEITVNAPSDAVAVTVTKGGISASADITDPPGDEPVVDESTATIEIPPLPTTQTEAAPKAIAPGTWPSPIDGFRAAVAGVALVGLVPVGDEKTPYPSGAPLGAGKRFWLQTGYYKSAVPT